MTTRCRWPSRPRSNEARGRPEAARVVGRPSEDIGGPQPGLSIAAARGIRGSSSTAQAILQTLLFELNQGRGERSLLRRQSYLELVDIRPTRRCRGRLNTEGDYAPDCLIRHHEYRVYAAGAEPSERRWRLLPKQFGVLDEAQRRGCPYCGKGSPRRALSKASGSPRKPITRGYLTPREAGATNASCNS